MWPRWSWWFRMEGRLLTMLNLVYVIDTIMKSVVDGVRACYLDRLHHRMHLKMLQWLENVSRLCIALNIVSWFFLFQNIKSVIESSIDWIKCLHKKYFDVYFNYLQINQRELWKFSKPPVLIWKKNNIKNQFAFYVLRNAI